MSLDLIKVVSQVSGMVAGLKDARADMAQRLRFALKVAGDEAVDLEQLRKKIAASRTTWLVADLLERIDRRHPAPPAPADFTVTAADGSHIDVDRHRSARCYLINIGSATLSYGAAPDAALESFPRLYSGDADLVISPPEGGTGREQPVEGALLGIKRDVEECLQLAETASSLPPGSTILALMDGTLIKWSLEAYPEFVTEALLRQGFLRCLDGMHKLNADRRLAIASYISFPRSTDVVNVLRVAICPYQPPDCDRHCPAGRERGCDNVAGVRDRELFLNLLSYGERSPLFISPSQVQKHYGEHRVHFFYLRLEDEVARVEVPQWVAQDAGLLGLAHSLILDQCRRGQGYPVALSEAHELAVVSGADRENFWHLVEASLAEERLPAAASAKSFSKRTRWI